MISFELGILRHSHTLFSEHITYVPVKQGAGKKVARPAGVKGKFKVVDRRMKSEMRADKARERRQGKRPSGGRGLNSMNRKSMRR